MTLINVLVDKYRDRVIETFDNDMRELNNPYKTYEDKEDSTFEIDLESDKIDKFMNNKVECTFSNLEIVDQAKSKNKEEILFAGDNATIGMRGASLAYTHYSDKTQLLDNHPTKEQCNKYRTTRAVINPISCNNRSGF